MKTSLKKSWVLLALAAVSTMTLLAIMAFSQERDPGQEREPAELRQRHHRAAASGAVAGQADVSPPWAWPLQELTFPACAFQPYRGDYDYYAGISLYLNSGTGGVWYAPIILPDYTQIRRIILIAEDTGASSVQLSLYRITNTGSWAAKKSVLSTGSTAGYRRFVSSYVSYQVKNLHRAQLLRVYLPGTGANYELLMAKILYKNCYWPS